MKSPKMKRRNTCYSMLSKELLEEYKTRSIGIRRGDTVSIMRGIFKEMEGKVIKVDHKKSIIHIEGVTKEKANGDTFFASIHSSNVMIKKLNLEDKRRKDILERRAAIVIPEAKIGLSLKRNLEGSRRTSISEEIDKISEKEKKERSMENG